jgi:Tfp pilus assembly PilM family ATPase
VGTRSAKAVQLVRSGPAWRLKAAAFVPRRQPRADLDAAEVRQLLDTLARQGLEGRRAVLAAARQHVLTGILEVPPAASNAPRGQIARMEMARMHNRNPASFEMACWDLPPAARSRGASHVMAAACDADEAGALLDRFEQEGLDVRALETLGSATVRACGPLLAEPPAITGILDIGWTAAVLTVVHYGTIVYERTITEGGMAHLLRTATEQFEMDADTANRLIAHVGLERDDQGGALAGLRGTVVAHLHSLAGELRAPFSYAAHQYPDAAVERLLLVGGGASLIGVADYMASVLGMAAQVVRPSDLAECPPAAEDACGPAMTAALGLAQWAEG